jgi:hypothetical protein
MNKFIFLNILLFSNLIAFSQSNSKIRLYADIDGFFNDSISVTQLDKKCISLKYEEYNELDSTKFKQNSIIISSNDFNIDDYSIKEIEISSVRCLGGMTNLKSISNCLNINQSNFITPNNKVFIEVYILRKEKIRTIFFDLKFY